MHLLAGEPLQKGEQMQVSPPPVRCFGEVTIKPKPIDLTTYQASKVKVDIPFPNSRIKWSEEGEGGQLPEAKVQEQIQRSILCTIGRHSPAKAPGWRPTLPSAATRTHKHPGRPPDAIPLTDTDTEASAGSEIQEIYAAHGACHNKWLPPKYAKLVIACTRLRGIPFHLAQNYHSNIANGLNEPAARAARAKELEPPQEALLQRAIRLASPSVRHPEG